MESNIFEKDYNIHGFLDIIEIVKDIVSDPHISKIFKCSGRRIPLILSYLECIPREKGLILFPENKKLFNEKMTEFLMIRYRKKEKNGIFDNIIEFFTEEIKQEYENHNNHVMQIIYFHDDIKIANMFIQLFKNILDNKHTVLDNKSFVSAFNIYFNNNIMEEFVNHCSDINDIYDHPMIWLLLERYLKYLIREGVPIVLNRILMLSKHL